MMKPSDPRQLTIDLLARSICSVQVAAVVEDHNRRIVGWGWNSVGSGFGEHAEASAIRRSNRKRLKGATIYVASTRMRNGKTICSRPCDDCDHLIRKVGIRTVIWLNNTDIWHKETKL